MSERQRQQRIYQIQRQKYLGVGNEDTTKEAWADNVRKDTYHSLQGHSSILEYLTLANNSIQSKRDMKVNLIKKMVQTENSKKRPIDES
ncbi:similar to Saccharomyces cerevisiae YNL138W-A YSF3 Component of the SF3b subcomplex of the U2 snRNP, essential protein required for for splicing and for assembly of SF3b [Maudiozyma saulgeensis]|uniref:Similar to Saccharomyces cerevisiae YNL138W-A YSF3 Component of the SF3b subcomplex of the U2 snRNP, essential protein required for for splicing and for assembly of SF3b n=1 Tax=Maudiozyma saulgeensis TaxID=1789683 RepID=A0A1X7QY54_9SACH|nr:similar to Saccharomyces cerevisiae YNL138W-A YSF3 Component of the SF3b subcomplex of the U2 snRNP, essential protein required for for splicing and for assembly of SF3b [Kazachstania saulgeensis]